jgi:hypothetical protein
MSRPKRARVAGVGQKREVSRLGVIDAGDAVDFKLSVAFEAACQTLGDFAKFQGRILMAIRYQPSAIKQPTAADG